MDKNKTNLTIEQSLGCLKEINLGNVPALAPSWADRIKSLQDSAKSIIGEYPFMEKFFQDIIKCIADEAKKRLSEVYLLR